MARRISFLPQGRDKDSGHLLPWVIAVMVYLSALALTGGLALHHSVRAWTADISRSVTVQIVTSTNEAREAETAAAIKLLKQTPGVENVRRLEAADINRLLEPWLGQGNVTEDLPVPVLIDVTLKEGMLVDTDALRARVKQVAPGARVDDHQQWIGQLMKFSRVVETTAMGIVLLIVLATVAIVMFGTKAGLAAHHNTIETLHVIGAKDNLIANAFQRRFVLHGMKGGLLGLFFAGITMWALGNVASDLGSDVMLSIEFSYAQLIALFLLPVFSALIAMITARITVRRALAKMV